MASPTLAGVRVLVVDDDEDARELLTLLCTSRGARAWQASSAEEGVRLVVSERPDIVLTDLGVPGGHDGYDFLRAVRRLPNAAGSEVVVVALTGRARSEDREATSVAGFHAHVIKPIDPAALVQVIASLVAATTGRRHESGH